MEDNLAALRILEEEALAQDEAVKAAEESVRLTTNRYTAGTISYLELVTAQTIALTNQRTAVDILGWRVTASVLLIKALGGGWSASTLPPVGQLPNDERQKSSESEPAPTGRTSVAAGGEHQEPS